MTAYRMAIAGLLALFSGISVAEDAPKPATPEDVARQYLEAVRERGFAAQADFLHPQEMASFQTMLIPVFQAESEAGGRALINATFGREASLTDVRTAPAEEFMRRFSRVMAVRLPDQPVAFDELTVLGSVREDQTVHVLVRLRVKGDDPAATRLEVVSLRPFEETWKRMLGPELRDAVRAMDRRGQDKRPAPRLVPQPEER